MTSNFSRREVAKGSMRTPTASKPCEDDAGTFYALQILDGHYQQDFKECFEIPVINTD